MEVGITQEHRFNLCENTHVRTTKGPVIKTLYYKSITDTAWR
jgi:hypothetical protein